MEQISLKNFRETRIINYTRKITKFQLMRKVTFAFQYYCDFFKEKLLRFADLKNF